MFETQRNFADSPDVYTGRVTADTSDMNNGAPPGPNELDEEGHGAQFERVDEQTGDIPNATQSGAENPKCTSGGGIRAEGAGNAISRSAKWGPAEGRCGIYKRKMLLLCFRPAGDRFLNPPMRWF